jgi:L-rhamnose mutarotase
MKYLAPKIVLVGLSLAAGLFTACGGDTKSTPVVDSVSKAKPVQRKKIVIEIIAKAADTVNTHALYDIVKSFGLEHQNITSWKNRVVVYADITIPDNLIAAVKKEYPTDSVVNFDVPMYEFNRSRCADTVPSKEQTNLFLTANLVADPKMQQQYVDYHKTQFEKWPEVAKGFCNASFQQVLVFKKDRQLILVISIPKSKTLDDLNPLTTKDNPRVDEWNKLMSQYQEGLLGTKKGETWVFLTQPGAKQDGLGK